MAKLVLASPDRFDPDATPVAALAHNEANIIGEFLGHYRRICHPTFLIVDDRSDDGTREFLARQPDVTLFEPADGSTFSEDQAAWRTESLDRHCAGRWVLVPDIDEHFVFARMESRSLPDYIAALDREGAEAVVTLMLDMYADRPLADHIFDPAGGRTLPECFPFFDGPAPLPQGYLLRRATGDKRYPTPPVRLSGGMQDRLFARPVDGVSANRLKWLDRFSGLDQPINPGPLRLACQALAEWHIPKGPNRTKLGLVKWRPGMRFGGGPHRLNTRLPVSESIAGFLHFVFTRGREGLEYYVARGQHARGARGYRAMLENAEAMTGSPVTHSSRRYHDSGSLTGLIRDIPLRA